MKTNQTEMASAFQPYGYTPVDRKRLKSWGEQGGHCSLCLTYGVHVAHVGIKNKAHVALCGKCIGKFVKALPSESEAG